MSLVPLASALWRAGTDAFQDRPVGSSGPDPTIHLTATLVSPIDIALEWKDTSPDLETKTTVLPVDWKNLPAKAATPPQAG